MFMKKLAIISTLLLAACTPAPVPMSTISPSTTPLYTTSSSTSPLSTSSSPLSTSVQIAMVDAVGEPGPDTFGCGDRIVMVNRSVSTTTPLQTALTELFSVHNRDYGQSGLITALDQTNIRVNRVNIDASGMATIELTGSVMMGGTCDSPRIQEQVNRTIRQFSSVRDYRIFLNGSERNWRCLFNMSGNC